MPSSVIVNPYITNSSAISTKNAFLGGNIEGVAEVTPTRSAAQQANPLFENLPEGTANQTHFNDDRSHGILGTVKRVFNTLLSPFGSRTTVMNRDTTLSRQLFPKRDLSEDPLVQDDSPTRALPSMAKKPRTAPIDPNQGTLTFNVPKPQANQPLDSFIQQAAAQAEEARRLCTYKYLAEFFNAKQGDGITYPEYRHLASIFLDLVAGSSSSLESKLIIEGYLRNLGKQTDPRGRLPNVSFAQQMRAGTQAGYSSYQHDLVESREAQHQATNSFCGTFEYSDEEDTTSNHQARHGQASLRSQAKQTDFVATRILKGIQGQQQAKPASALFKDGGLDDQTFRFIEGIKEKAPRESTAPAPILAAPAVKQQQEQKLEIPSPALNFASTAPVKAATVTELPFDFTPPSTQTSEQLTLAPEAAKDSRPLDPKAVPESTQSPQKGSRAEQTKPVF